MSQHKRRTKLIKPRLQLKIILVLLAPALLSVCAQAAFLTNALSESDPSATGNFVLSEPALLAIRNSLVVSIALTLVVGLAVGVLTTFRIAGPVYRFETYLTQLAEGRVTAPCRIRARDELHELCAAINRATEPLRSKPSGTPLQGRDPESPLPSPFPERRDPGVPA